MIKKYTLLLMLPFSLQQVRAAEISGPKGGLTPETQNALDKRAKLGGTLGTKKETFARDSSGKIVVPNNYESKAPRSNNEIAATEQAKGNITTVQTPAKKEKKAGFFKRLKNRREKRKAEKTAKRTKKAEIKKVQQQTMNDEMRRVGGRLSEEQRAQQIHNERKGITGKMPARKPGQDISKAQQEKNAAMHTEQDKELKKAGGRKQAPKPAAAPAKKSGIFGNMFSRGRGR